ncbi:sugar phosphate isomerase/epimerase [Paenibacillus sp. MWE-103]|uniref:Sugar phosphate isomerase/epimerase n=1 Tax=Paenibacillus artemisiicola TaxID=1172618 RepID=A0ABS3WFP9_9BACL|nr:sugar phosphate isomerase/epimerase [Paenibacillus artemisiicola]MBO7747151.1 sugar phosphate isomerase/epimerase [Paenibacillus artemisiicola]
MKRNQIAAQLYTVRGFTKTAEELDAALGKIKAIGYEAVQVSGIGPIAPETILELCRRHGLTICATHVPFDRLLRDLEQVIEVHRAWDCRYAGLGSMPEAYRTGLEGYREMARLLSGIGAKLAEAGIGLIYHNHKFEFEKMAGKPGLEWLLELTDARVGFEVDTYWVQAGGADPVKWIRKAAGRMKVVHLKDMAIVGDAQRFAEIGEGNLDWPAIIEACRDAGVEWYVAEQDVCPGDPFESLAISYRALREWAE